MKTIYLKDGNYNWKEFQCNEISELKADFEKRNISIGYDAKIGNNASIGDYSSIGNNAKIGNNASIGDYSSIGNNAKIGYDAKIGDNAKIGDYAKIGDEIKLPTGFYIIGSKHAVTYTGNATLSIGCHNKTIFEWIELYKKIGEKEGYDESQISEYYTYILMAETFYNNLKN